MKVRDRELKSVGPRVKPAPTHSLQPILGKKTRDTGAEVYDTDLFHSLLGESKKTDHRGRDRDRDSDSEDKENHRPNVPKAKKKMVHHDSDKLRFLEEELYAERHKNQLLQEEVGELEDKLEQCRGEYRKSLEVFRTHLRSFKTMEEDLLKHKNEEANRALEVEEMKIELAKYKESTKATLEFVIKSFEIIALLPDSVEVDVRSHDMMEFSFDEKKAAFMPKNIFLESRIVKFLEANESLVMSLELEGLLFKIIEEYEKKKSQGKLYSHKVDTSPSKHKKKRSSSGVKSMLKRSSKKQIPDSSFGDPVQESGCDYGTDKNNSMNNSFKSSSGGKNNYSININLVVNDNSDSALSDQANTSGQVGGGQGQHFQNFIKFFEKELGCSKANRSESSIVAGDSLLYSPSDKGARTSYDTRKSDTQDQSGFQSNPRGRPALDQHIELTPDVVVAEYPFQSGKEGDLSLTKGDKIRVLRTEPSGWWVGLNLSNGRTGYFPSNFVAKV
jgi:hypothetical protein